MTADFQDIIGDWKQDGLGNKYQEADGFPHIVIDNFLKPEVLEKALAAFPAVQQGDWINYTHVNERKFGLNKMDYIPAPLRAIIEALNTRESVRFLEELTGIKGLMADPGLEGGGLHQIEPGGFLNIHADFTVHPHHRHWRRRVNLLLYLNHDWEEAYGGKLELWTRDMKRCFRQVLPIFNRCVVFNTDRDSYHGHPHPLTCPEGRTRKSIALYYFTEAQGGLPEKRSTDYQPLPTDSPAKRVMIYLDKRVLDAYSRVKSVLGINDDFASKLLNIFSKNKR